jgi:two-component system CheB/CheR fusion protein
MTERGGAFDSAGPSVSPITGANKTPEKGGSHPIGTDVLDCIELPIVVVNRDCAVVSFNPAAATLLSLAPSDVGRRLRCVPPLADVKNIEEACEHVIGGGTSSQWEVRDGAGSWFSVRIGPCRASNDNIVGAVLTLTNVTALRASLEQAIAEREHTKTIINTVMDPLVVLDEEFRVQAANQAFYQMFQVSREVTRRVRLYELGTPDWDVLRLRAMLNSAHSHGRPEPLEVEHELPIVGCRTLLLNARCISRGGHLDRMTLVAIHDITERKRAAVALEETLRYNEIFAAILAHDLRSPLGAIVAGADLLKRRYKPESEGTVKALNVIQSSAGRMARMIEQLLDLTRGRSGGGIPIDPRFLDLRELAALITGELEGATSQPIIVQSKGDTCGTWDGDRLAQVIANLLGNAAEHGESSQPIRLSLDGSNAETVGFSVSNAGMIPEGVLPTLFDPFRGGTTGNGRKSKGLGLGLYIVQQIVHAHGGTIEAQSSADEGTTFRVSLPRTTLRASDGQGRSSEVPASR